MKKASALISKRIAELGDWRGKTLGKVVKLTFANVRRAIDIHEGEEVDASAFKALVRQAVALNKSKP